MPVLQDDLVVLIGNDKETIRYMSLIIVRNYQEHKGLDGPSQSKDTRHGPNGVELIDRSDYKERAEDRICR